MRIVLTLLLALIASSASALPPVLSVKALFEPIVTAQAADLVRRGCDDFRVHKIRALREAAALENRAIRMGYSQPEIRAVLKDKAARAAVRQQAQDLLKSLGAGDDRASVCAAGDQLILTRPLAGKLISR